MLPFTTTSICVPSELNERLVPPHSAGLALPRGEGSGVKWDKRLHMPHQKVYSVLFLPRMGLSFSFPTNVLVSERDGANHLEFDWLEASLSHSSGGRAAEPPFPGLSKLPQQYRFKIGSKQPLMPIIAGRHLVVFIKGTVLVFRTRTLVSVLL